MGSIDPVTLAMTAVSMVSAERQANKAEKAQNAQYEAARQRALRQYQLEEEKRKDALKKSLAARRARFGASGTGLSGGSNRALLNGLIAQKDKQTAEARERTGWNLDKLQQRNLLKMEALDRDLSAKRRSLGANVVNGLLK